MTDTEKLRKVFEEQNTEIKLMAQQIDYMRKDLKELKESLAENYITKIEFNPVKKISYGVMSFMVVVVMTVFGAVVSYVGKKV